MYMYTKDPRIQGFDSNKNSLFEWLKSTNDYNDTYSHSWFDILLLTTGVPEELSISDLRQYMSNACMSKSGTHPKCRVLTGAAAILKMTTYNDNNHAPGWLYSEMMEHVDNSYMFSYSIMQVEWYKTILYISISVILWFI